MRERSYKVNRHLLVKARGLRKQSEVARLIGKTKQHLWNYENGFADVPESALKRLCNVYGIEPKALIIVDENFFLKESIAA